MKIREVISKLKRYHQPFLYDEKTRDLVLCGDIDNECNGICVTCCATYEILEKCKEIGLNLIISHEGITYNYEKAGSIADCQNEVVRKKIEFAEKNNIVIFRDHDAMHGNNASYKAEENRIDYIFYGIMKETGWEPFLTDAKNKPLWYRIPTISAKDFGEELIDKWNLNGLRIVGDLNCQITNVFFCEHVNGGIKDVATIENCQKADAIIPLEICDYTVTTYVRDASYLGKNKVIFEMGHFNAEELGMKYFAKELSKYFKNELRVEYVQSGDGFTYLTK